MIPQSERLVAVLLAAVLLPPPAAAQHDSATAAWSLGVGAMIGVPDGWVQVRERQIEGTRLRFGRDLNVANTHAFEIRVAHGAGRPSGIELSLASYALNGTVRLQRDVLFNGTTLAAGSTLATRTDFPRFVRIDIQWHHDLFALGRGGVSGVLGLTAILLTFELHGTIAPTSVGHETREDFVSQELPVPVIGGRLHYPIARRLVVQAAISGGYLPWINSLRREGGEVRLTQSHVDVDLGAAYALTRSLQVAFGYRDTDFTQRERSREDGNDIHLRASGLTLGVVRRF